MFRKKTQILIMTYISMFVSVLRCRAGVWRRLGCDHHCPHTNRGRLPRGGDRGCHSTGTTGGQVRASLLSLRWIE